MIENGLYKIKDEYYLDFPNEKHIHNKKGRPFFYAIKDNHEIYWLIPISSQIDAYKRKIEDIECKRGKGKCLIYHIGIIAGQERVFRICNMVPISDEYIDGEFFFDGSHYIVKNKSLISEVNKKSKNYIKQLEIGRMFSQIDALKIRDILSARKTNGGIGN